MTVKTTVSTQDIDAGTTNETELIVCDPGMVEFGYTKTVANVLRQKTEQPHMKIFIEVEPNPSTNTVYKGTETMVDLQPDTIFELGGG